MRVTLELKTRVAINRACCVAIFVLTTAAIGAQQPEQGKSQPARAYVPAKTADGQPNISGMWLPGIGLNMEAPAGEPWKAEYAAGGNGAAFDFGATAASGVDYAKLMQDPNIRKPLVNDPPDGKIPLQPWAAERRTMIMANQDKVEYLDPRIRCLQAGVPRSNLPVNYNTYQFMQIPGYVVLLYEWNHMTRIIPIDGRPHLPASIRLSNGDSRGRWEGNTLVVDVTNFTDDTWVVGHGAPPEGAPASSLTTGHGVFHSDALHVVERFTPIGPDTIRYEATVEDPKVFTQPWRFAFNAFERAPADHQLFEYACHEGNRQNILLQTGIDIEK
jgi:hypothetical protein